jgi:hypothetical protein
MKKGCEKIVDDDIIFVKGKSVLEYHAKLEASTKLKCNWASISKQATLVQHKRKKRKVLLWRFFMMTYLKLRNMASIVKNGLQNLQGSKLYNA